MLQERIVSKSSEPVHSRFAAKPGELAFRVAAGSLLNRSACLVHRESAPQDFTQFAVADKVERFGVFGQPGIEQGTNLLEPAVCEHGVGSGLDALVQGFAAWGESNLCRVPTLQWSAAASVQFGKRHLGEKANFNGANQLLPVGYGNFLRSFGIEARQNLVQVPGTMLLRAVPQSFAKFFRALRDVREAFQQGAQIQTSANGENREARAAAQVGEDAERHLPIASRRCCFLRTEHIKQVMRHAVAHGTCRLSRANIEPAIELRGITRDYFAAKLFRQPHAQR